MGEYSFVYGNMVLAYAVHRSLDRNPAYYVYDAEGWFIEVIEEADLQEIKITLRVEFDRADKAEREKLMLDIAKDTAKELLAQAAMIKGKRDPSIALECGDFFADEAAVKLFDETSNGG